METAASGSLHFFDDSAVFDELSLRLPVSARTGNNTQLSYDALDRCVKIEERTIGSLTSTKQFIWCGTERCEERDGSGALVTQFFPLGYKTGGNSFFYNLDHLGSVREVTNSSGAITAQVAYSPWGEPTLLQGSALPDFGYAGYYNHPRSGLNLTLYRAYSAGMGRWLSRDPLGENAGVNLYGYVDNDPANATDPTGLGRKEECEKAKCDAARLTNELAKRIKEQEGGRTDPDIVKSHQKAFLSKQIALIEALRRWVLYCKDDDPPPPGMVDLSKASAPVPKPKGPEQSSKMIQPPEIPWWVWLGIRLAPLAPLIPAL